MSGARVLVVDDDAWIVRMVTTVLEKHGHEILAAFDGDEGFRKALASHPDLIITDVMMPKMDGWTLVKLLRSKPAFAFTPVIFMTALGSEENRIKGFRLGADDYVPKPFRFEELDLRIANALRRCHQVEASIRGSAANGAPGIHGTLDQLGLASLLTVLEMERKTGVLVLHRAPTDATGQIWLRAGRVISAQVDEPGPTANAAAVFAMLDWTEGRFEFIPGEAGEIEAKDEMDMSTTTLLIEGARLSDETVR